MTFLYIYLVPDSQQYLKAVYFICIFIFIYKGLTSNANDARNYARPKTTTQVPAPHLAPVPPSEHTENSWHLVVAASVTVLS